MMLIIFWVYDCLDSLWLILLVGIMRKLECFRLKVLIGLPWRSCGFQQEIEHHHLRIRVADRSGNATGVFRFLIKS